MELKTFDNINIFATVDVIRFRRSLYNQKDTQVVHRAKSIFLLFSCQEVILFATKQSRGGSQLLDVKGSYLTCRMRGEACE